MGVSPTPFCCFLLGSFFGGALTLVTVGALRIGFFRFGCFLPGRFFLLMVDPFSV